jgi:hypothetical protein
MQVLLRFERYLMTDSNVQVILNEIKNAGFIVTYRDDELTIRTSRGDPLQTCYNKMQIHAFAKQLKAGTSAFQVQPTQPASSVNPEARIAELEALLGSLIERERLALTQGKQWEQRARTAELQLTTGAADPSNRKYRKLKTVLAKLFHPDHSHASGIEKMVRTETFKLIWSEIEKIDRS